MGFQIKYSLSTAAFMMLFSLSVFAQNDRKVIRQGVKAYQDGNYSEAEVQFRKAGDLNMRLVCSVGYIPTAVTRTTVRS